MAGIAYPFGRTMGKPDDAAGQRAVLEATLQALEDIREPGTIVNLPFEWPESPREARGHLQEPPPIVSAIKKRPMLYRKLLAADFPAPVQAEME